MRVARERARSLPRPTGEVNIIGLLLLLAVTAAAFVAWVWVPVAFDHQKVERVVREHASYAVKDRDDAALILRMTEAIGRIATVEEVGADGRVRSRRAIDVRPQDVTWERRGQTLHVSFGYVREVLYPYVDRRQERYFTVDLTTDISLPRWDDGR
jgi:hypothetical protein